MGANIYFKKKIQDLNIWWLVAGEMEVYPARAYETSVRITAIQ